MFYIRRKLGQGSHSVVYEASDDKSRQVAVKISPKPHNLEAHNLRHLAACGCKQSPRVVASGSSRWGFVLVLDVVGKWSLWDFKISRKHWRHYRSEYVAKWYDEAITLLHDVHQCGMVHGDVKPENMVITNSGIRLIDFASCVRIGETVPSFTPLFASRSVRHGWAASPADDVYALQKSFCLLFSREIFWTLPPSQRLYPNCDDDESESEAEAVIAEGLVAEGDKKPSEVKTEVAKSLSKKVQTELKEAEKCESVSNKNGAIEKASVDAEPAENDAAGAEKKASSEDAPEAAEDAKKVHAEAVEKQSELGFTPEKIAEEMAEEEGAEKSLPPNGDQQHETKGTRNYTAAGGRD